MARSRTDLAPGRQASTILCVAFASDGSLLASGGHEGTVRLWDPKLGTPIQEVPHPGPVSALAWIPIAILWFGVGDISAIFLIFLAA